MEEGNTAPAGDVQPSQSYVAQWRWWVHLLILTAYPIMAGLTVWLAASIGDAGPVLPTDTVSLAKAVIGELIVFGVLFTLAWLASRATAEQLLLKWRGGVKTVVRGFVYSLALRLGISVFLALASLIAVAVTRGNTAAAESLRPTVENIVNAQELSSNPVYLILNLTVVSFVLAGFREELWRAGMLAGLGALFPARLGTFKGQIAAAGIAAVLFGLGHISQGWGGVAVTALLGWGLGTIMVYQRSIWEAVLAHGFFNATTFALLFVMARWRPDLLPAS